MTTSLVHNQNLVRRVYFERLSIPLSAMLGASVDFAIGLVLTVAAMGVYLWVPPVQVLLLPALVVLLMAATLGIGLMLAAINVRYRDIGHLVPFGLQTLLFLTPVVYPASLLPEGWRLVYSLNPLVGVIEGIRWCLLGTPLYWPALAVATLASAALCLGGLAIFRSAERSFADTI